MIDPFKIMGLSESATPDEVKERFRELSKTTHPDAGGSAEAFAELHQAYKEALDISGKPKLCFYCDGKGRIKQKGGFFAITVPCTICSGTGRR